MPTKILVYANASLQEILLLNDRNMEHTLYFARRTVTDPLHSHNMAKKGDNIVVRFYQLPEDVCEEVGLYGRENRNLKDVAEMNLTADDMGFKGNQNVINVLNRALRYVLMQSEAQLKDNYDRGVSEETQGFKINIPSYLNVNNVVGSATLREGRGKASKKKQQADDGGETSSLLRDRSPHRNEEVIDNMEVVI